MRSIHQINPFQTLWYTNLKTFYIESKESLHPVELILNCSSRKKIKRNTRKHTIERCHLILHNFLGNVLNGTRSQRIIKYIQLLQIFCADWIINSKVNIFVKILNVDYIFARICHVSQWPWICSRRFWKYFTRIFLAKTIPSTAVFCVCRITISAMYNVWKINSKHFRIWK